MRVGRITWAAVLAVSCQLASGASDLEFDDAPFTPDDTCDGSCSDGPQCTLTCENGEDCKCEERCDCVIACPDGTCDFDCKKDATCTGDCIGEKCECKNDSSCNLTCRAEGCKVKCDPDASCVLDCAGVNVGDGSCWIDCKLDSGPGGGPDREDPEDCGGGVLACRASCP